MSLISTIKSQLPPRLIHDLRFLKKHVFTSAISFYRRIRVARIRKKKKIHILFIAVSQAIWKVDSLYKSMLNHPRFEVDILASPNMTLIDLSLREADFQQLKDFFDKKGYSYKEWCDVHGQTTYKRIPDTYDIVIYPQPYATLIPKALDYPNNKHKLLINCEYAFHSGSQAWAYNKDLQNLAWIDCYENEAICQYSRQIKSNKGTNSYVTGLPFVDEFTKQEYASPWKPQKTPCKKIIWAPHWTIVQEHSILPCYSNFLTMADFMRDFAKTHERHFQFAFKPHPWLKRELYRHPAWGKERTDAYYEEWANGENTQLEQGQYVDLFMTSDAMVHDCSSFCCEYLLTGKPVLFMARNEKQQTDELNKMAYSAYRAQYIGHSNDDLQHFLQNQVLQGEDSMKEKRAEIANQYLKPPHGQSAANHIIAVILGENV